MIAMASCGMCQYGAIAKDGAGKISFSHKVCKRFPPTPVVMPAPQPQGFQIQPLYPIVATNDGCGEYQAREEMELPGERKPEDAERPS